MKKPDDHTKDSVSVPDSYSSANYDMHVVEAPRKPVLYTHDGKPLTRGLRTIGYGQKPEPLA